MTVEINAILPHEAKTFPQMIRAAAAHYGDEIAITATGPEDREVSASFTALDHGSGELARGLLALGVGKGTRVGFIFGNGPDFAQIFAAAARIGAIAVPISTMIRAKELVRVLRQSDIACLFIPRHFLGTDYSERLLEALPDLRGSGPDLRLADVPYLRWIAATEDGLAPCFRTMASIKQAALTVTDQLLRAVEDEVHPTDQIVEIYTSGSMALPKGVKHLHGPVLFRAHYLAGMTGVQRGGQSQALLPMFWVGGLMMTLLPNWMMGAKTICPPRTLNNSRVAMGSVLAEEDLKLMASAKPYWGLGMSETLGPYAYGDELRAPGYPLCAPLDHWADRFEVRLVDDNSQCVEDGVIGEIQVRGYALSPALHKMDRDEYLTDDGFYRTGDLGKREGSRVHFMGRSGDMVKTAGSNVSPAEVELEMQSLDGIRNAFVVGLPDKERGQLLAAAVIAREGVTLDFAAIEATLRQRLSSYKVPRAYVEITVDQIPMLHSNKVSRRMILDLVTEYVRT